MDTEQITELSQKAVELVITYGTEYSLKILAALAIFLVGRFVAKSIVAFFDKMMRKAGIDQTITGFLHNSLYSLLLVLVILAALATVGIQTASFIAILGAAGLAVGLALQGSLSNFAAGVMLILFRPFKEGDYVDAGGAAGTVEKILVFSTQFITPDNKRIIVPNSNIIGGNIINFSSNPVRRVDWTIGVSYSSDLQKTRDVLRSCLDERTEILKDRDITIAVSALADSSVHFVVRVWVNSADYWPVFFGLNEAFKNGLDAAGIEIPFPQMDVHVKNREKA